MLLSLVDAVASASCNVVAILEQIHFELVLALKQILRDTNHAVLGSSLVMGDLVDLLALRGSLRQDGFVALAFEGLQPVAAPLLMRISVEVNLFWQHLLLHLHVLDLGILAYVNVVEHGTRLTSLLLVRVANYLTVASLLLDRN